MDTFFLYFIKYKNKALQNFKGMLLKTNFVKGACHLDLYNLDISELDLY
jgi:hypothetical protein